MAFARELGFEDFAQPAGGCCFLTDESYSVKLKDMWDNRGNKDYELDDIMLLKVGRHIRPCAAFKLIVAREEGEVNFLSGYRKNHQSINTVSHNGPIALVDGDSLSDDQIQLAGSIIARYSKGRESDKVVMQYNDGINPGREFVVTPFRSEDQLRSWLIS